MYKLTLKSIGLSDFLVIVSIHSFHILNSSQAHCENHRVLDPDPRDRHRDRRQTGKIPGLALTDLFGCLSEVEPRLDFRSYHRSISRITWQSLQQTRSESQKHPCLYPESDTATGRTFCQGRFRLQNLENRLPRPALPICQPPDRALIRCASW